MQNIKALGLPLSEKKNSKICLLCCYAWTSEPHGRTSPDPRGIVWTNLVEVHKDMLHAKYQGSRLSIFKVEELWNFHSLFLCSTYDPQGGASFDPRGILWTNLVEVHKEMPHTKYLRHPVSEKKNFKDGLLCSYVPTCDPRGRASFDPRGIIWTNLVEVLKEMLYTKYHSSRPSSFRKEKFRSFSSLLLCFKLVTLGAGPVLTPGVSYDQTW